MKEFSPDKPGQNRELTEKQKALLEKVWECNGDAIEAARQVGYADPYSAVDSVAEELNEMAQKALARLSIKSVKALENVLDSDDDPKSVVIQANEKLKAAQMILDRTNPKVEKVDITADHKGGVFVLPEKRPVVEEEDGE